MSEPSSKTNKPVWEDKASSKGSYMRDMIIDMYDSEKGRRR